MAALRLGVNVDHVATVRNARGGALPDPVRAALIAIEAGADGITAHLARGSPPHPRRRHAPPQGRDLEAAQFRNGGDRADARHRAAHPPARLLPGAGKAHRAHHRGRPRRHRRPRFAQALRRRADARRHPRLDVRRAVGRRAARLRLARRAGGRAAHRRLVRRARRMAIASAPTTNSAACASPRRRPRARPGVPRRPRPRLRHRARDRRAAPKSSN